MNAICLQEVEQQERLDMIGVSDDVLQVHGVMPGRKQEGIATLLYENVNSLPNQMGGNNKLRKDKRFDP